MIKFDKRNYRKHNDRNKELIKKSLEECGAGRSIVIDNDDEMNARMYKGVSYKRNASIVQEQNSNFPVENGGATPTYSLHNIGENND